MPTAAKTAVVGSQLIALGVTVKTMAATGQAAAIEDMGWTSAVLG